MAELSSGTVHVLLPKDIGVNNFFRPSVWADIDWAALQKNSKVTAVIHVNHENNDKQYFKGGTRPQDAVVIAGRVKGLASRQCRLHWILFVYSFRQLGDGSDLECLSLEKSTAMWT